MGGDPSMEQILRFRRPTPCLGLPASRQG